MEKKTIFMIETCPDCGEEVSETQVTKDFTNVKKYTGTISCPYECGKELDIRYEDDEGHVYTTKEV